MLTSGEVARRLGTSVPRVLRAARDGALPTVKRGNRTLFDPAAVEQLRRRWGFAPPVPGLSREDVLVLAALSRRPRGLRSVRAVARAAGVSPTTATGALARLASSGHVAREQRRVTEGHVKDLRVWTVRWASRQWLAVAATVGAAVLPARQAHDRAPSARRGRRVPRRLAHVFWNQDLHQLDVDRDAVLIADRILRSDDLEAHAWLLRTLPEQAILAATRTRNQDPRHARLGELLARATR
jgi:excisionase family DNA binding protein